MLLTETNTLAVERKIRGAFRAYSRRRVFETFFEHGQWWVRLPGDDEDAMYSVVDTNIGFDFERV